MPEKYGDHRCGEGLLSLSRVMVNFFYLWESVE